MAKYRCMPARSVSGFRFVDPTGEFGDVEKRATYVYLNKLGDVEFMIGVASN